MLTRNQRWSAEPLGERGNPLLSTVRMGERDAVN
jgi:hypothetical protein